MHKPTLPTTFVSSVATRTGAVVLTEADITGLTTDLAATEKTANKGVANGYASLNSSGQVPASQLPSSSGGGMPSVVASLRLAEQTTAVSGTLYTPTVAGIYRVSINVRVYTIDSNGGDIYASWSGNDGHGLETLLGNDPTPGVNVAALSSVTTVSTSYLEAGAATSYVTTFSNVSGTPPHYDVLWVVEQLA
jgi:hypothetical protein